MSLLMNALKKAERAKESGQSEGEVAAASESHRNLAQELGLDPPAPRKTGAIPSIETKAAKGEQVHSTLKPMELALEPEPTTPIPPAVDPEIRTPDRTSPRMSGGGEPGRGGARAVFSAKAPTKAKSKTPFYTVVGISLLATAGYGTYLWMQMFPATRPVAAAPPTPNRPSLPPPAAPSSIVESPTSALIGSGYQTSQPAPSSDVPSPVQSEGQTANRTDGITRRGASLAERTESIPTPSRASERTRDIASASGGATIESPANLRITRNADVPTVNPDVLAGYTALQAGDLDRAGQAYDRALRSEPTNRDALLGAATVLLRLERTDAAEAYFRQLLRLHPHDTYATAQLAALTARGDPVGSLSQVNSMIAREADHPETASGGGALPFVQGNQLAAQGRWPEAQQAYFNAHRADPANADYCYNLAISLDRIREPRLARDFYRKALELARGRAAGFDVARAQLRLDQIDRSLK